MGSRTFEGVRFQVYSRDHLPPHVHGFYGSITLVVELGNPDMITFRIGSVQPPNAKRSDVKMIVEAAEEHYSELMELWEATHGKIGG